MNEQIATSILSASNIAAIDLTDMWTNTTATAAATLNTNYYQTVMPNEPDESDVFKQITSLLGIKIVNVSIKNGKVVLYGRRNKRKFIIEIESNAVVVKGEKGEEIVRIPLSLWSDNWRSGTITVTPNTQQPQLYAYPGTTTTDIAPQIWYTTDSLISNAAHIITNWDSNNATLTVAGT